MTKKRNNWKVGFIIVGLFVLFVGWVIFARYLVYWLNQDPNLGTFLIFGVILVPIFLWSLRDVLKLKNPIRRTKQILYWFIWPLILLSFGIFFLLTDIPVSYPFSVIIILLPGIYILLLTIKYREYDERYKHSSGIEAIVVGCSYFLGFLAITGLPLLLLRVLKIEHKEWHFLTSIVAAFVLPRLAYTIFFKDRSKPPVVTYTTQEPDLSYESDSPEIIVDEAIKLVKGLNWGKMLQKKKALELAEKETCPPQIIFNSDSGVFSVICQREYVFKIYVDIQIPNKKRLGFGQGMTSNSIEMPMEEVLPFLRLYFENRLDKIQSDQRFI